MNNTILALGLVVFISVPGFAHANEQNLSTEEKNQIERLLNFVKKSDCLFIRNGDKHTGKDAAKHIARKYKHFRDDIKTPEEFIELSATKSSMSGKYYQIRCVGKEEIKSKDWLLAELVEIKKEGE